MPSPRKRKTQRIISDIKTPDPIQEEDMTVKHPAHAQSNGISNATTADRRNENGFATPVTILNGHATTPASHPFTHNSSTNPVGRTRKASMAEQISAELAHNSHSALRYATAGIVVLAVLLIFPHYFSVILRPNLPPVMDGFVAPGFEKVADTFRALVKSGEESGGSFSVYHRGQLVVNLWGGYADWRSEQPWSNYTVSKWFSVTKAMAAVVVAMLVDSGELDYEARISSYWPEFAANGKQHVTVRHLMSHRAGLAVVDGAYDIIPLIKDPHLAAKFLEKQKPNWTPGAEIGYHALTWGLYVEQLVRRADTQSRGISRFFKEEIAEPFGIDLQIGLPRSEQYRAAHLDSSNIPRTALRLLPLKYYRMAVKYLLHPSSLVARLAAEPRDLIAPPLEKNNKPERRELQFASSEGYGPASGVAKLFSLLSMGSERPSGQLALISDQVLDLLSTPDVVAFDSVIQDESIYSMGMKLYRRYQGTQRERLIFGHPGIGGQMGYADRQSSLGWGYVTNFFSVTGDGDYPVYQQLERAMYDCVEQLEATDDNKIL